MNFSSENDDGDDNIDCCDAGRGYRHGRSLNSNVCSTVEAGW